MATTTTRRSRGWTLRSGTFRWAAAGLALSCSPPPDVLLTVTRQDTSLDLFLNVCNDRACADVKKATSIFNNPDRPDLGRASSVNVGLYLASRGPRTLSLQLFNPQYCRAFDIHFEAKPMAVEVEAAADCAGITMKSCREGGCSAAPDCACEGCKCPSSS